MHRTILSLIFVGFAVCGAHALADDAVTQPTMTKSQLMKDCIERQKATNVSMSKAEMKSFCRDQLKQQKQSGDFHEAPPTDTPRN